MFHFCVIFSYPLQNIQVNKDFEDLFKETLELLPNLKVKHGGTKEKVKPKPKMNPMAKLQKYIQVNNLRLVDFFNKFDKDGSMSVNYEEFEEGLLVSIYAVKGSHLPPPPNKKCKESWYSLPFDYSSFLPSYKWV